MAKLTHQEITKSRLILMKHLNRALSELINDHGITLELSPNEIDAFMAGSSEPVLDNLINRSFIQVLKQRDCK